MKSLLAAVLIVAAPAVSAQDFSQNSQAKPWNLAGEAPARFEADVVDLLCEVAGDCENRCTGRPRALGLLRRADNALIFPMKNGEPVFAGASVELEPYCGRTVEVDGLLVSNPETGASNAYMVQRIRPAGEAEWVPGTRWGQVWRKSHPDAPDGPWFRNDPRVNAAIAKDGYLGLGRDADAAFIAEWF